LNHGSRKDRTTYFDFWLSTTNEAEPQEETFFIRKLEAQIHEVE